MKTKQNLKQFKINKVYSMNSSCDINCFWSYEVIGKTTKSVKLHDLNTGEKFIRRIKIIDNTEYCMPLGSYSMAPTLRAGDIE